MHSPMWLCAPGPQFLKRAKGRQLKNPLILRQQGFRFWNTKLLRMKRMVQTNPRSMTVEMLSNRMLAAVTRQVGVTGLPA